MSAQSKFFSSRATLKGAAGASAECAYNLTVYQETLRVDVVGRPTSVQYSFTAEGGNLLFLNSDGKPDSTASRSSGLDLDRVLLMETSSGARYNIALRGQPEELAGGWEFEVLQIVFQPAF